MNPESSKSCCSQPLADAPEALDSPIPVQTEMHANSKSQRASCCAGGSTSPTRQGELPPTANLARVAEERPVDPAAACCAAKVCSAPSPDEVPTAPAGADVTRYRISNMDCPTEERLIRNKVEPIKGVLRLDFNLMSRTLTVHHELKSTDTIAVPF